MNTRKLLSTLATAALILFGSSLLSACSDSLVGESPEATIESTDLRAGKQLERYFREVPPAPQDDNSTATDSTSAPAK
ncbi:MAG: hypothetical protein HKN37_11550 [Rhodothermales bacterium]|nr:hypothetical protein [Rhodothermales bacterium]